MHSMVATKSPVVDKQLSYFKDLQAEQTKGREAAEKAAKMAEKKIKSLEATNLERELKLAEEADKIPSRFEIEAAKRRAAAAATSAAAKNQLGDE